MKQQIIWFKLPAFNGLYNLSHPIIGEQTIVDAILNRLVHNAHRIDIKGESMSKKMKNKH